MPDSAITKKALAAAMKELMKKKPFSKISVSDICELCSMNRKSFYYHFRDKYDLVNWIYYTEFAVLAQQQPYESEWELIEAMCRYFYANRDFYAGALMITGQNSFSEYFSSVQEPLVLGYLRETLGDGEEADFCARFMTDAVLLSITKWLTGKEGYTADEFVSLLRRISVGIAKGYAGKIEGKT